MCISVITRLITSTGHGAPAIIPVRRLVRSKSLEFRCRQLRDEHGGHAIKRCGAFRLYRLQRGACIEGAEGSISAAPLASAAMVPITHPKQWYIGTGTQMRSRLV